MSSHWWVELGLVPLVARALSRSVFRGGCQLHTTLGSLPGFKFFFFLFDSRAFFSLDACHLFSQCMLAAVLLLGDVTDVVVTKACPGY